jgi:hypothetical protein
MNNMRVEPENGIVTLMRGDTFVLPVHINDGTKLEPKYRSLSPTERLYFGLMEPGKAFENAVVKKVVEHYSETDKDGNPLVILQPKDTEKLLCGKYYYTIKLRTINEQGIDVVKTIVPSTLFFLMGNNPVESEKQYYQEGKYDVTAADFEGGEIVGPEEEAQTTKTDII